MAIETNVAAERECGGCGTRLPFYDMRMRPS